MSFNKIWEKQKVAGLLSVDTGAVEKCRISQSKDWDTEGADVCLEQVTSIASWEIVITTY